MLRYLFPASALALVASAAFQAGGSGANDDTAQASQIPERADLDLSRGPVPATNLKAPPGFEATVYADDDLVHDASCLTVGPAGRIAVSAPGYVRLLIDHNGDGRADEALPFADGPKSGAQGLYFDGSDLLAVGDGGLNLYRDADRDLRADGQPTLLLPLKTGGEHHAHAVRRGPDGAWYLICGNETGVTSAMVTDPQSPIRKPEAGVLLRFEMDQATRAISKIAVVADGLRNCYDFDFTAAGDPVTYDSDDEREVSLPWYRPTRVFRLSPGSHGGWISRSWKRPDAYPEMPEVLASLGRGSPTGVEAYRAEHFPAPYRDAVFVCDWTFGRVVAIPLGRDGTPGAPIEFLKGTGSEGFAPTDLAVAVDGTLYVSAGGRGTNGRVYRVRYVGPSTEPTDAQTERDVADRSLTGAPLAPNAVGLSQSSPGDIAAALSDTSVSARKAAMRLVHRLSRPEQTAVERLAAAAGPAALVRFHLGRLRRNDDVDLAAFATAVSTLESGPASDLRYDAVRLAQLALGDIGPSAGVPDTFSGYSSRADLSEWAALLGPLRERLVRLFPTGDGPADEEFVRLLAMLRPDDPAVLDRLLARITQESHPTDDLHHLFALARIPVPRSGGQTAKTADALIRLDAKLESRRLNRDTNWDERLVDLFSGLTAADPELAKEFLRHPEFGRAAHAALLRKARRETRVEAAERILRASDADAEYAWSPDAVALLGTLGEDAQGRLRSLYDDPALRAAALSALAAEPQEADRGKFVEGLADPLIEVAENCVSALEKLTPTGAAEETVALAAALKRLDRDAREYALRDRVAKLLAPAVDGDLGFVSGPAGYRPQPDAVARWIEYARSLAPATARAAPDEWQTLRASLPGGASGDPARGRRIYEAKACNRCHDGGAVGPDLSGVTGRFSREDLFLAIADPDRDISSRYRGTVIQTTDGRIVSGLVVYQSADGVMLKDGEKTVRVEADEIEARSVMETSLMPRGLLSDLRSQDLADLEAYLRTLAR